MSPSPRLRRLPGRRVAAATPVLLLGLAACTGGDDPAPARTASSDGVTLGVIQLIPDEGTRRALLRVENDRGSDLEVSEVGLAWPGYGPAFLRPQEAVVPAGSTLDLRFTLPRPVCSPTEEPASDEPAVGVLRTAEGELRAPLKDLSQDYLRRLWRAQCDAELVARSVDVRVGREWRQTGAGADAAAVGTLTLARPPGSTPDGEPAEVELLGATGSVLYDLEVPQRTIAPTRAQAVLPLRLLPNGRCDEHARGQATAPFDFELRMRVDDRPVLVPLAVPVAASNAGQQLLDRVCGPITSADQTGP